MAFDRVGIMGNKNKTAFKFAFKTTLPILTGFAFLGVSYGIYMNVSGFGFWYPMITSFIVFGGSLEFVIVNMLLGAFNPLQAFMMALFIQARHIFYGIAMLERYRDIHGIKKFYLIFGLCDETFSINCAVDPPPQVDRYSFYLWVTFLNRAYWILGSTLGGILGSVIKFNTEGLGFVMTALFVVIFLDQWLKEKKHYTALIGVFVSVVCLLIFGADNFLIPAMAGMFILISLLRKPIEKAGGLV